MPKILKELTEKEKQQLQQLANKHRVSYKELEHDYWFRTRHQGIDGNIILKEMEQDLSGDTKQTPLAF